MIDKRVLVLLAFFILIGSNLCYADLPVCSNSVINAVTTRVGCTVGDPKCWLSKGGFCYDYIQKMAMHGQSGKEYQLKNIKSEDVKRGDVAQFNSQAHYAYVESVVKDKSGKPVAVNLSEYNYGTCWVDESSMVTDKYKKVNKRLGLPMSKVDGGFLRPQ